MYHASKKTNTASILLPDLTQARSFAALQFDKNGMPRFRKSIILSQGVEVES